MPTWGRDRHPNTASTAILLKTGITLKGNVRWATAEQQANNRRPQRGRQLITPYIVKALTERPRSARELARTFNLHQISSALTRLKRRRHLVVNERGVWRLTQEAA
jgi:hypothetical protein